MNDSTKGHCKEAVNVLGYGMNAAATFGGYELGEKIAPWVHQHIGAAQDNVPYAVCIAATIIGAALVGNYRYYTKHYIDSL